MSNVPGAIRAATEPQVNLIPPEVAGRKAQGRRTGLILIAFLILLSFLGAATYFADTVRSAAQSRLDASLAETARLEAEIASYQYVIDAQAELSNATHARLYAGAADLQWSPLLAEIWAALPEYTTIATLGWSPTSIDSAAAAPIDGVFDVADIGYISIAGQSANAIDVPDLQDALDEVPGLARARVLTVVPIQPSDGALIWTFTAEVRLTFPALSGHFTEDWLAERDLLRSSDFFAAQYGHAMFDLFAAQADADEGVSGAEARIADAEARLEVYGGWADQVAALETLYQEDVAAVSEARADVDAAAEGTDEEIQEAQAALEKAQADLVTHRAAVIAFTKVALAYADAVNDADEQRALIAQAEARVEAADEAVASAREAIDKGTDGAADALAAALVVQGQAVSALDKVEEPLPDLETAVTKAQAELDTATKAAAAVAPVRRVGRNS